VSDDRIVIRGTGLITPLGGSVEASWHNLLAGKGIRTHSRAALYAPSAAESAPSHGTPREGREGGSHHIALINRPPEYRGRGQKPARVDELACAVAAEAISSSRCANRLWHDDRTALVVATSKGAADHWLSCDEYAAGKSADCFGLAGVADSVARYIRHGDGPRLTLSGACASGLHALIRAAMLIEHGDADRAIVVAAESSLHPLFLQSFRRLGVLPPEGEPCRPFDVHRQGFLVSEAAAAVVLERAASSEDHEKETGDVRIDRYGFAGDADHLTGFSGRTLRRLLYRVIDGRPVDLIHAHGTGTEANDITELGSIDAILAHLPPTDSPPFVYSHKGAIGHTLGAAGLVSIVLNVEMHRRGIIPPNAGLLDPMSIYHARIEGRAVERRIRRSVAMAAGFGGATAVVGLQSGRRPM
jgi:3-oxoacyl-[acyl-carrier-protein] synthase II